MDRASTDTFSIGLVIGHLGRGGAERNLATLAPELRARGWMPVVFCLSEILEPFGGVLAAAGIPVEVIPRRGSFDATRVLRLARSLRRHRIEIAHSFLIDSNVYTLLAARLAGVRTVVTSNLNSDFPRGRVRRWFDGIAFRRSALVWTNAEYVKCFTTEFFSVPERNVVTATQPIDLTAFHPARDPPAVRAALGIPDGPVLGTVGSLTEKKAPLVFFQIADELLKEIPELVVLHAGDGPLRSAVEAFLQGSPRRERIRLLGARDDVEQLLQAIDVLLLTSRREGLPTILLEAMATGVPAVAPAVGGCAELIRHGKTGLIASGGRRDELLAHTRVLLRDAELRDTMAAEARLLATTDYSLERSVDGLIALYRAARARSSS